MFRYPKYHRTKIWVRIILQFPPLHINLCYLTSQSNFFKSTFVP